jgi:hypothetical protein
MMYEHPWPALIKGGICNWRQVQGEEGMHFDSERLSVCLPAFLSVRLDRWTLYACHAFLDRGVHVMLRPVMAPMVIK